MLDQSSQTQLASQQFMSNIELNNIQGVEADRKLLEAGKTMYAENGEHIINMKVDLGYSSQHLENNQG